VIPGLLAAEPLGYAGVGGWCGYQVVGTAVGSPFWVLKKAFYDGPRALAKKLHQQNPTPKNPVVHDPDE
jgi:hypothetical protein